MHARVLLRSALLIAPGLLALPGCGGDDVARAKATLTPRQAAAEAAEAAAIAAEESAAATPGDIERVLRLGGHLSVAEAADEALTVRRTTPLSATDRWRIRRAQLIALASLGRQEALDEAWSAAEAEQEVDQLAALAGQIYVHLLDDPSTDQALLSGLRQRGAAARESFMAGALQPQENLTVPDAWRASRNEAVRRLGLPTGHPEGFPRAWLAPDERPEEP
ncbi:MAG: hypothetical protein ACYTG2_03985 [Planctomycetota bacterium]|jgi:hypothetical protein